MNDGLISEHVIYAMDLQLTRSNRSEGWCRVSQTNPQVVSVGAGICWGMHMFFVGMAWKPKTFI